MADFDPAGVWQRAHPSTGAADPREGLPGLIAGEREDAAWYALLARRCSDNGRILLCRLREDALAQAACLAGILFLATGQPPGDAIPRPEPGLSEAALRQCYLRTLNRVREYERRSTDREFGPAFSSLAVRGREHCRILLALLGRSALEKAGSR